MFRRGRYDMLESIRRKNTTKQSLRSETSGLSSAHRMDGSVNSQLVADLHIHFADLRNKMGAIAQMQRNSAQSLQQMQQYCGRIEEALADAYNAIRQRDRLMGRIVKHIADHEQSK